MTTVSVFGIVSQGVGTGAIVVDIMYFYREVSSYSRVWSRVVEAEAKATHMLRIQGP